MTRSETWVGPWLRSAIPVGSFRARAIPSGGPLVGCRRAVALTHRDRRLGRSRGASALPLDDTLPGSALLRNATGSHGPGAWNRRRIGLPTEPLAVTRTGRS